MTTVFNLEAYLSLCWFQAGNGIQGFTRDCTGNERGERIAWQNDRQKMPLPGKFHRHQSRHERSVRDSGISSPMPQMANIDGSGLCSK
jgi:hypothetical protein